MSLRITQILLPILLATSYLLCSNGFSALTSKEAKDSSYHENQFDSHQDVLDHLRRRNQIEKENERKRELEERLQDRVQQKEDAAFEFSGLRDFLAIDTRIYLGTITNTGEYTKKSVTVTYDFYDTTNAHFLSLAIATTPSDLEPGKSGTFQIKLPKTTKVTEYKTRASWTY